MVNKFLLTMLLLLSACAKKKHHSDELLISQIPDQYCTYHSSGMHDFHDGIITQADAYDCGQRENKYCFYYIDFGNHSHTETICQ